MIPRMAPALSAPQLVSTSDGLLVWFDGTAVYPRVTGGSNVDPEPPPEPVVLTPEAQAEVDRLVAARLATVEQTAANRAAAEREQAIQAYLQTQQDEADRAGLEEAERLRLEAADAATARQTAEAETARVRTDVDVERRLFVAGVGRPADDTAEAAAAAQAALTRVARLVNVQPGADQATIDAEIATLRTEVPTLFTPVADSPPPPPPGATPPPPRTPGNKGGATSAVAAGAARYAAEHAPAQQTA